MKLQTAGKISQLGCLVLADAVWPARRGEMIEMRVQETEESLTKPKWLNINQLMEILPLKKSRIYYLTHIGTIPHHKVGQTLLFQESEILEWMQNNKVTK